MNQRFIATFVTVVLAVVLAPGIAAGQSGEKPLSLTFVDATPNQSAAIHDKLKAIIRSSDDIDFSKPSNFLFSAQKFDITLDTLSTKQGRTSHRELLRRAMRAHELEAIVVYKRTGKQLHLICIGPTGAELKHFRSPIRQPRITDRQAVAVLKKLFEVLVPEVRSFRQQQSQLNQNRTTIQEEQELATSEDEEIKEEAVEKHKQSHGNLEQNVTLSVAPIFGRRQLNIQTTKGFKLGHATPFFGGSARLDTIFGLMSAETAALGGSLYGIYAPFTTRFGEDSQKFQGTFFRAGLSLRYLAGLSSSVVLFGQVGGQTMNLGIKSNPVYVGSTYVSMSGGLGMLYRIREVGDLRLAANALPTLSTNTNDQAFGPGGFSLGFNGVGGFTLRLLDPILLSLYYDFTLYQPKHPKPRDYDSPASGTDSVHMGGLSLGYSF